jgi:hypothetical protein
MCSRHGTGWGCLGSESLDQTIDARGLCHADQLFTLAARTESRAPMDPFLHPRRLVPINLATPYPTRSNRRSFARRDRCEAVYVLSGATSHSSSSSNRSDTTNRTNRTNEPSNTPTRRYADTPIRRYANALSHPLSPITFPMASQNSMKAWRLAGPGGAFRICQPQWTQPPLLQASVNPGETNGLGWASSSVGPYRQTPNAKRQTPNAKRRTPAAKRICFCPEMHRYVMNKFR